MRAFKGWRRFPCADRACAIPIHPGILGFRVKKEARQWLGASPLPLTEYQGILDR